MLHHMLRAAAQRAFNVLDPYFQYVTMLLHGDGTNAAQNNTFLDSSTNNFSITRNGNTTQGTFTPYGSNWSMYQSDASSAYLGFTTSVGTSFQFAGDFTIEGWVYYNSSSGDASLYVISDNTNYLALNISMSAGNYNIYLNSGSPTSSFSHGISVGVWTHVAMVRSGSTVTLYTNGVSKGTITNSSTLGYSAPAINRTGGGVSGIDRYISNIRVVKSAVYTSAFTPSTTPLTAIANTSLLTCQSNRFVDNSSNAFTATITGSPSVQRFSPFSPTTAYSTSVIGGSGYFDGTGDTISFTDSSNILDMGGVVASLEMWVYPTAATNASHVFGKYGSTWSWSTSNGIEYAIAYEPAGFYLVYNNSGGPAFVTDPTARSINQWYHVAIASDTSNNLSLFVNGTRVATTTTSITKPTTRTGIIQGGNSVGSETFTGYIANMNFILGSGAYSASSSTITIPTAPSTVVTNTKLLVNYTNAGILDNAMMNDLETVGNAQISTSVKKYGTGSMYFDGSGDGLIRPVSNLFDFASGDFTVEFWANCVSTSGQGFFASVWEDSGGSDANSSWLIRLNSGTIITHIMQGGSTYNTLTSSALSTNTWFHFAWVRNGSTQTMYINGTSVASGTVTGSMNTAIRSFRVGYQGAATNYFNGYIDDLRITKGVARYTTTFTPPTAAFPNN